jgi:hypothetical protein
MCARLVGLMAVGLLAAAGPAFAAKLTPVDIQATFFTGKAFTASTASNIRFTMVFTPDGKATRAPQGKSGVKSEGTWKLSKDGYCTTWKNSKPSCYTLVTAGANKWNVMRGPAVVATWSK